MRSVWFWGVVVLVAVPVLVSLLPMGNGLPLPTGELVTAGLFALLVVAVVLATGALLARRRRLRPGAAARR